MGLGIVSVEGSYLKSSCASPFYLCVSMATLEQSSLSSQLAWTTKYVVSHQPVSLLLSSELFMILFPPTATHRYNSPDLVCLVYS